MSFFGRLERVKDGYAIDGEEYSTPVEAFYFKCMGFCSCGNPEEALQRVHHGLRLATSEEGWPKDEDIFLAYSLDAWGLTEHGTSIGFPWLTPDGQKLLALLEESEPSFDSLFGGPE